MDTAVKNMQRTINEMHKQLEHLSYQLERSKDYQELNGSRLDILQQRILSHEAFIDVRLGSFAERWSNNSEEEE